MHPESKALDTGCHQSSHAFNSHEPHGPLVTGQEHGMAASWKEGCCSNFSAEIDRESLGISYMIKSLRTKQHKTNPKHRKELMQTT